MTDPRWPEHIWLSRDEAFELHLVVANIMLMLEGKPIPEESTITADQARRAFDLLKERLHPRAAQ